MEQFRQIGEVLGSVKVLMVFKDEIRINQRQCLLLVDALNWAFDSVAKEIRESLRFDERHIKWKSLEHPLRELLRVFRGAEQYLRYCTEAEGSSWWAKAISLRHNSDGVEFHLHNLLWCLPVVVEAVEAASELSGCDHDDIQRRRILISKKYDREFLDPKLFQLNFGRQYLVSRDMERRLVTSSKEDRWALQDLISDKRRSQVLTKHEQRLAEILLAGPTGKLFPTTVLVGSKDYVVKRRLGSGILYKEIQWMGEGFAVRHFFGDIEPLVPEISLLSSLSHPNVMNFLCSFSDEERKECFLLMDLMSRDLGNYLGEISSPRRKVPFPLPVAVDIMLQIARGMEYLHSRKICHGNLNPSNILVRPRGSDGYLHVKISAFGRLIRCARTPGASTGATQSATSPLIWCAPEVLLEKDQAVVLMPCESKYAEKADVYSFAMVCFELLTGKVPFEDGHMQGEKMSRNVRAGERPLFPFPSPKYLTNLTKRCWQADPSQRPCFSSICRVLRYIKRFLLLNPGHSQPDPPVPVADFLELEASLCRRFPSWISNTDELSVAQIPFQMFAYRMMEREKTSLNHNKDNRSSESGSEGTSLCSDDNPSVLLLPDDPIPSPSRSPPRPFLESSKKANKKKLANGKPTRQQGLVQRGRLTRPPHMSSPCSQSMVNLRRSRSSGHTSDSEVP